MAQWCSPCVGPWGPEKKVLGSNSLWCAGESPAVGPLPLSLTLGRSQQQQRVCWDCCSASLKKQPQKKTPVASLLQPMLGWTLSER